MIMSSAHLHAQLHSSSIHQVFGQPTRYWISNQKVRTYLGPIASASFPPLTCYYPQPQIFKITSQRDEGPSTSGSSRLIIANQLLTIGRGKDKYPQAVPFCTNPSIFACYSLAPLISGFRVSFKLASSELLREG